MPVTGDVTLYAKWTEAKPAAPGSLAARTGDGRAATVAALLALAAASLCAAALGAGRMRARAHPGRRAGKR